MDHGLDLSHSFVIGDSRQDVETAGRFGGRGVFVTAGWAAEDPSIVEKVAPHSAYIADSMETAVGWVLGRSAGADGYH
jgi:phosphoglycolate phosphatase-like HAD superfamily hydrolase